MMYRVYWFYREGEVVQRRWLGNAHVSPCIEAARLIAGNPYTFGIDVIDDKTDESVPWRAKIGRVLDVPENHEK